MITAVADRRAEVFFLTGKGSGQCPREHPVEAAKITVVRVNSHEGPTWN